MPPRTFLKVDSTIEDLFFVLESKRLQRIASLLNLSLIIFEKVAPLIKSHTAMKRQQGQIYSLKLKRLERIKMLCNMSASLSVCSIEALHNLYGSQTVT